MSLQHLLTVVLLLPFVLAVDSKPTTDCHEFAYSAQSLAEESPDALKSVEEISLEDVVAKDILAVLKRLQPLTKLERINWHNSDLSSISADDVTLPHVKTVLIGGGTLSQGTIQWLAKMPAGNVVVFGGCDVRNLDLSLGNFKWVTFDNAKISKATIQQTVGRVTEVTFKEVTVSEMP